VVLFICAKDLLSEAMAAHTHGADGLQVQHSRPWLAGMAAMPKVLPVQFKQMLCSNGVKLSLDLTVADECDSNHEQCCGHVHFS
jgi:hypothetical protein